MDRKLKMLHYNHGGGGRFQLLNNRKQEAMIKMGDKGSAPQMPESISIPV